MLSEGKVKGAGSSAIEVLKEKYIPTSLSNLIHQVSPLYQPSSMLRGRAILLINGEDDKLVPFKWNTAFYDRLKADKCDAEKISFWVQPGTGHEMSHEMKLKTYDWFYRWIFHNVP
jgi:fermentation-respiration switch protein FrsA (DUF1100 family)